MPFSVKKIKYFANLYALDEHFYTHVLKLQQINLFKGGFNICLQYFSSIVIRKILCKYLILRKYYKNGK